MRLFSNYWHKCLALVFLVLTCQYNAFGGITGIKWINVNGFDFRYQLHDTIAAMIFTDEEQWNGYTKPGSTSSIVTIPSVIEYDGDVYIVRQIDDNAFSFVGNDLIKELTLPSSLLSISNNAFIECTSIETLTIDCPSIDLFGFSLYNLTTVHFGPNVESIYNFFKPRAYPLSYSLRNVYFNAINCHTFPNFNGEFDNDNCCIFANQPNLWIVGNVTRIPQHLCSGCTIMTEIPSSVLFVDKCAFDNCINLKALSLPNSLRGIGDNAFANNTSLTSLHYNAVDCSTIGSDIFEGCNSFDSLYIGGSVARIPDSLFASCDNLSFIDVSQRVIPPAITMNSFNYSPLIELNTSLEGVELYYEHELWGSFTLKANGLYPIKMNDNMVYCSVDSDNHVAVITSPNTFYGRSGTWGVCNSPFGALSILPYVSLFGEIFSVTSIDAHVFDGCDGITSIVLPESITFIGEQAFANIPSLIAVNYNVRNCTEIGNDIFEHCAQIDTLSIGVSVESIPQAFITSFANTLSHVNYYAANCNSLLPSISNVRSLTIGEDVIAIPNSAFRNWTGLQSVRYAANQCVSAGSALQPIFADCTQFSTLDVSDNVISIPNYAFIGCESLDSIIALPIIPPILEEDSFGYSSDIRLTVGASSSYRYEADPYWSQFFIKSEGRDWNWIPEAYPNNMTIIAQIRIDGEIQASPELELGAFNGDVCHGKIMGTVESFGTYWYLTITGDNGQELEYYLRRNGTELNAKSYTTLIFNANGFDFQIIDFVMEGDYKCVTDNDMLVAGRKCLILSGNGEGSQKALGAQSNDSRRAVESDIDRHKVHLFPSVNPSSQYDAFSFILGEINGMWTFYDEINHDYLVLGENGELILGEVPTLWEVVPDITGEAILKANDGNSDRYVFYNEESNSFETSNAIHNVALFVRYKALSGTITTLSVTNPSDLFLIENGCSVWVTNLMTQNHCNLIIEDGAQLINVSPGVKATVEHDIISSTTSGGWYTIASPTETGDVSSMSNLANGNYDLYRFAENGTVNEEWQNYKANSFSLLRSGSGYLYANSDNITIQMKGILNVDQVIDTLTCSECNSTPLAGFNLIGNPFQHNIYKGVGGAINNGHLASGYYMLEHDGMWQVKTYSDPIKPGQGILVKTEQPLNLFITNTSIQATGESDGRSETPRCIRISVTDGCYCDHAYLYLCDGTNLDKIPHHNHQAPSVAIQDHDKPFAIAHVNSLMINTVNITFKGTVGKQYLIEIAPEKTHFHNAILKDKLTNKTHVLQLAKDGQFHFAFVASAHDGGRFEISFK